MTHSYTITIKLVTDRALTGREQDLLAEALVAQCSELVDEDGNDLDVSTKSVAIDFPYTEGGGR